MKYWMDFTQENCDVIKYGVLQYTTIPHLKQFLFQENTITDLRGQHQENLALISSQLYKLQVLVWASILAWKYNVPILLSNTDKWSISNTSSNYILSYLTAMPSLLEYLEYLTLLKILQDRCVIALCWFNKEIKSTDKWTE